MKTCFKCKIDKDESEFYKNKDRLQSRCKSCFLSPKQRKAQVKQAKIQTQKHLDWLIAFKKDKPCADCGIVYPHYVMDFDHRNPEDKVANVSTLIRQKNMAKTLEEIAKCDLVCANCHRIRTHS